MALYTVNKVLRDPDYYDAVVKSVSHKTPLQNILRRGPTPIDWMQEVEVEPDTPSYEMSAQEGGAFDRTGFGKRLNLVLQHQLEKFRSKKGWAVTHESELLPSHTERKGEKAVAREMRKDAQEVVLSIERAISSEQEAVARGTSDDTVAKTRGLMSWLKPATAHVVQPIPSALRPSAGLSVDVTSMAAFNETVFQAEAIKAALECGDDALVLTGLVGLQLKKLMSQWLGKATAVQGVENLFATNRDANSKRLQYICDEFAYDGITIRTIVDNHLYAVADGVTGAYSVTEGLYSGAFIRPDCWSIDTLLSLTNRNLADDGSGKCGFHEAILRLACRNPLGQFAVKHVGGSGSDSSSSS